jgi:hypothetical protein
MATLDEASPVPIITIPDDMLRAIGKVNVVWGVLESVVELSVIKLAGFKVEDSRGAIVTAHMTWPLKMDILEACAVALAPEYPHLAKFGELKPLLKKAQEGRNRVAHGMWGFQNGQTYKSRATARGKLKISIEPITLDEMEAISLDIHKAGVAVIRLVLKQR